jgi:hypothetical protein
MSGVGKTTAARTVARRYDLWFYALDSRTYAHAERMNVPGLAMSPDELWIERTPKQMADDFETEARDRFPLVLEDLQAFPADGAPVLVDGPQLQPDLVDWPALFVVASSSLQRALVIARGSYTYARTRDPEAALTNRVRRDELLAKRLRTRASVAEIDDVRETEPLVERFVQEHALDWIGHADRGDVAARRRDENERRLDQWRRYAAVEPRAREGTLELACECDRPGCGDVVSVSFQKMARPRLAH